MTNRAIRRTGIIVSYAFLFGSIFYLLFTNLDSHPLWADEAETAVLARNVARFGIPRTVDEINHIMLAETFQNENATIWKWSPWLQEYVAAASYRIFGITTWSSRAPFAAAGWLSVLFFAAISWPIYRRHDIVFGATALLGFSEIFLLHARQCRYYALSIFFAILLIYAVYSMVERRSSAAWLLAAALTGQFYSNYILAIASTPVLLPLGWIAYRDGYLRKICVATAVFGLTATPWVLYAQIWRQSKEITGDQLAEKIRYYVGEYHFHFVSLIFLLLPLGAWLARKVWLRKQDIEQSNASWVQHKRVTEFERILLFASPLYGAVILAMPGAFSRYLLPLLPIGCLLCAAWSFRYLSSPLAVGVIAIQATTNYFSVLPIPPWTTVHHWRAPLIEYFTALHRGYSNRLTDVLNFFFREGHAGETICSAGPDFPLMFYTQLRVVDGRYISCGPGLPRWVLPQSASCVVCQTQAPLPDAVSWQYEQITIPVLDSIRGDSVPDPHYYQYSTTERHGSFIVYRKKEAASD